jgi:hypothetical protein
MNLKEELTKEQWKMLEIFVDHYMRTRLGQIETVLRVFRLEFLECLESPDFPFFGGNVSEEYKKFIRHDVLEAIEQASYQIPKSAFGSENASFGIKGLNDPIRLLGIQMTLRCCNFSDDLSKCPKYPEDCCAPLTGFCPKKK